MYDKLLRLYHTVRPLRFEQVYYRLYYRFLPLKNINGYSYSGSAQIWAWSAPEVAESSFIDEKTVVFLNQKVNIIDKYVWNNPEYEKLWLYNLHYFDDLNAVDSLSRKDFHYHIIKRWINENQPLHGNGWEPYPTALRIINWIKWYARAECKDKFIVDSIALQSEVLSKKLEYHILGNHLFANAKALVFSGCFLEGMVSKKYLKLGLDLLDREIPEQFLADGGHFELSPMYHCILLWDLLDLINLAKLTNAPELIDRLKSWEMYAVKALSWLNIMTHADGDISFFNDATLGIAARPDQIKSYASSMNLFGHKEYVSYQELRDSGYSRVDFPFYNLLFDHGEVGPNYLPGHAHADTLSFELSVGKSRFFVNSGTSLYGLSKERQRQRGSAAHNTVVVDNTDSSEVWGGFRVARRALITHFKADVNDNLVVITAQHDGYRRLKGGGLHSRKIEAAQEYLCIKDNVSGRFKSAVAIFHTHPSINISSVTANSLLLECNDGSSISFVSTALIEIEDSTYHSGFGVSIPSKRLVVYLIDGELEVSLVIKKV